MTLQENQWFVRMDGENVCGAEFEVAVPTSEEDQPEKRVSRLFLRVGSSFCLYYGFFFMALVFFPWFFPGDVKFATRVSGSEDVSTGVETDGQLRGRRIVVTKSLVLITGGHSMMCQGFSNAWNGVESCWNRRLMMVKFAFKWGIDYYGSSLTPSFWTQFCFLGQYVTNPAVNAIHAIGINLCPYAASSMYRRKHKTWILWWMVSIFWLGFDCSNTYFVYNVFFLTELNEMLDRIGQEPSHDPQEIPKRPTRVVMNRSSEGSIKEHF